MKHPFTKDDLITLFTALKTFTDPTYCDGQTRLAYTQEDEAAHRFIITEMENRELTVRQDSMGNVFACLLGQDPTLPAIGTGSHLDTVPQGGAYDGIIGVLCGFYALLQFKPQQLKRNLELIIFRGEESSRFGISCLGSKTLIGAIDNEKWTDSIDNSGKNVFQAIDEAGYQSSALNHCLLDDAYLDAFVEVHIEQGKCLEAANKQIGIVNGIAAPTRFCIDVIGHADHSGATPMNQRQDALVASASLIMEIQRLANNEAHHGTVGTVGKLDITPNAMNVIPGHVRFYVDIRGIEPDSIERVISGLQKAINQTQHDYQVQIKRKLLSQESPVKLSTVICHEIQQLCEQQNISYMPMLSGAGHDAMYMAQKYPTAMIFIPSYKGISHHHDEFSAIDDITLAAELLKDTLASLANK